MSSLNPDAPEFHPRLPFLIEAGYGATVKLIKNSRWLPHGEASKAFKTFTSFHVVTSQLTDNITAESNKILTTEVPTCNFKKDDPEYNLDKLIDFNDIIIDKININIDTIYGVNKPNEEFLKNGNLTINVSWNRTPKVSKVKMGSTTFIGAKNIPRPQLKFKDKIDNSKNLWVPKIVDKPNNIKPLSLEIIYNDQNEAIGYAHPYQVELDAYHPPAEFVEADTNPPQFPPPVEQTPLTFVSTEQQLDSLIEHLRSVKEFAVDVEHHSFRTYLGFTCLLQISTNEAGDFILDALSLREHLHKLNLVFTDPKILKVFHGASMDVQWLQRDFGVYIVGMFDTYEAAKLLNMPMLSLQYVVSVFCNIILDKTHQLADWRIRPLPEELIHYARLDTHYLLYIWHQLKADLLKSAAGEPSQLLSVFEKSRQTCEITYNKPVVDENSYMDLYVKSRKNFNTQQMTVFKTLYMWRDQQARELDENVWCLFPNSVLLEIAENLPREIQTLSACCPQMSAFYKQNLLTIHKIVLESRTLENVPQIFSMQANVPEIVYPHNLPSTNGIHDLKYFEGAVGEENASGVYLPNLVDDSAVEFQPDVSSFSVNCCCYIGGMSAHINKSLLSPYQRYTKYRTLAQTQEMNDFKYKMANKDAANQINSGITEKKILISANTTQSGDNSNKIAPIIKEIDVSNQKPSCSGLKAERSNKNKDSVKETIVKSYCYVNAKYKQFYTKETSKKSGNKKPSE